MIKQTGIGLSNFITNICSLNQLFSILLIVLPIFISKLELSSLYTHFLSNRIKIYESLSISSHKAEFTACL